MLARSDIAMRRSLAQPAVASVFTQGFLNASLIQLAICAPPRQAAVTRRYSEIYITELGAKVRKAAAPAVETVSA